MISAVHFKYYTAIVQYNISHILKVGFKKWMCWKTSYIFTWQNLEIWKLLQINI